MRNSKLSHPDEEQSTAISQVIQQDKKINNIHYDKKKKMELINDHNKAPEEKFNIKRKIAFYITSMNK